MIKINPVGFSLIPEHKALARRVQILFLTRQSVLCKHRPDSQSFFFFGGGGGLLIPKFDTATRRFLRSDRRHGA